MNSTIDEIQNAPSINSDEVEKFTAIADQWWDTNGKFKPLHEINPVRLRYIKENILQKLSAKIDNDNIEQPLKGINIVDIGCGGGLLSIPLARLGANVTGIDAGKQNIDVATIYAKKQGLDINFRHISVEELSKEKKKFDIVLNMEVIEHVDDVEGFANASASLVGKGGLMFVATLNRTVQSYAMAIIGAEYVMKWLPRGTHDWYKFLKPSEIDKYLENSDLKLQEVKGLSYNPLNLRNKWQISDNLSVNYMMLFAR